MPSLADKAELARIGRYYATESMLVLDPVSGQYDAAATPSTGTETLFDFYRSVVDGAAAPDRGDHAVFRPDLVAMVKRASDRAMASYSQKRGHVAVLWEAARGLTPDPRQA